MAITTLDALLGSLNQAVLFSKTASRTAVANIPFSVFDLAGNPSTGVLAVGNIVNGVVPSDNQAGVPVINAFNGANTGYLAKVSASNTVASRLYLFDRLFSAGAFVFNANVVLASQPSYAGRVPDLDYKGLKIFLECVTAFTGNQSIAITYTNELGVAGRTTGTIATGIAPIVGRMLELPLQAGDLGVQKIESIVSSVSTAGTFNVHVMRKLWDGRIKFANDAILHNWQDTLLQQVYTDSSLFYSIIADGTGTGLPTIDIEIVNG